MDHQTPNFRARAGFKFWRGPACVVVAGSIYFKDFL